MKRSKKCPKCAGKEIEPMKMSNTVCLDFGTYYLGDLVVPKLYICLKCGYSESWIDTQKDLDDIRKFAQTRESSKEPAPAAVITAVPAPSPKKRKK